MQKFLLQVLMVLVLVSCGTTKYAQTTTNPVPNTPAKSDPNLPKETTDSKPIPTLFSNININYKINKKGIVDTFNYVMDDFAKLPLEFPEQNTTVKLKRYGNTKIDIVGQDIKTTVAMNVDVTVKTFVKDFKANGILELSYNTRFDISKDWNLITKTLMTHHQWIAKPKMDLGVINLPIETLSNYIIGKSKVEMEKGIDQSIKESYNLKAIISELANYTLTPYKLDEVFGGWMQMTADSAYFSPAINSANYTSGKIQLRTKMNVSSVPPVNTKAAIPTFAWSSALKDSSYMRLFIELEYDYLTNIIRQNFVGKIFEESGKKVEVVDAVVGKKDNKLMIGVTTKGDFKGQLILLGLPSLDRATNTLYCKDVDVNVKTGNVLHKAAAWLFKGKIKSELDKMLHFNLTSEMANLQKQVDAQVIQLNKQYKMNMRVGLGSLDFNDIILRPDRANIYVGLSLKIDAALENLALFRD
jgi:hypothetical protein